MNDVERDAPFTASDFSYPHLDPRPTCCSSAFSPLVTACPYAWIAARRYTLPRTMRWNWLSDKVLHKTLVHGLATLGCISMFIRGRISGTDMHFAQNGN